jgi:RNA-binding protein
MDGQDAMQDLKATVWIGKQGLSESVIAEVILQLERRHRVKVKWLRNADFDPESLARSARATLVMVRGRTAVLEEQKKG